ncbi:hypothetical protein GCM10010309_70900 [Streptomyces violaceochromogenes]|nr:hypothetical protein GCM10010309_70900 [Streptomyces violaceochromogenes]
MLHGEDGRVVPRQDWTTREPRSSVGTDLVSGAIEVTAEPYRRTVGTRPAVTRLDQPTPGSPHGRGARTPGVPAMQDTG